MAKIKRLIPFGWFPAAWGLKGKTREIAEAEYYYTGVDLELELIKIKHREDPYTIELLSTEIKYSANMFDSIEDLEKEVLETEYKYNKISEAEYKEKKLNFEGLDEIELARKKLDIKKQFQEIEENDYKLGSLKLDLREDKLTRDEYDKAVADIKREPYVNVVELGVDPNNGHTFIELDWNDLFVKELDEKGYSGRSDDEVVNAWFNDLCRTVVAQNIADQDFGLQPVENENGREDQEETSNNVSPDPRDSKE